MNPNVILIAMLGVAVFAAVFYNLRRQDPGGSTSDPSPGAALPVPTRALHPDSRDPASINSKQQGAAVPSFDCRYAKTPTEKLLCTDAQLAALDREMANAHNHLLVRLPAGVRQTEFRREHLVWFKSYVRSCGGLADSALRDCVRGQLSRRASELRSKAVELQ